VSTLLPAKATAPAPCLRGPPCGGVPGGGGHHSAAGLRALGKIPVGSAPESAKGAAGVPNVLVANASGGWGTMRVQVEGGGSPAEVVAEASLLLPAHMF